MALEFAEAAFWIWLCCQVLDVPHPLPVIPIFGTGGRKGFSELEELFSTESRRQILY